MPILHYAWRLSVLELFLHIELRNIIRQFEQNSDVNPPYVFGRIKVPTLIYYWTAIVPSMYG